MSDSPWIRFALILALLVAGCAAPNGPRVMTDEDPDVRLAELLERWDALREIGAACSAHPDRGPVADCAQLQNAVERLTLEFPRHAPSLLASAVLSAEAGELQKAQSYLDALFAVSPSHPEAAVLRSRIAIAEGNLRYARRLLSEQVQLAPAHAGLREAQAGVSYLERRWPEAERALAVAEQLGAPAWRVAYHRGLVAEARGAWGEAEEQYQRALIGNPAFTAARARLAGIAADVR